MAGEATLDIKAIGMEDWKRFVDSLVRSGRSGSEFLEAIFNTRGFRDIIDHFRAEEGPDGKWKKRARSTQQIYSEIAAGLQDPPPGVARSAYNPSNKLLQLTGELRKSLIRNKDGNLKRVSSDSVLVKSNVSYSGKHDQGDSTDRIPKREFMWLSDGAQEDMGNMLLNMIIDRADRAS